MFSIQGFWTLSRAASTRAGLYGLRLALTGISNSARSN